MSAIVHDDAIKVDSPAIDAIHEQTIGRLLDGESAIDRRLLRWSDWCSPILIKECRQALKSRQFKWTFLLLMLAIVCWTILATVSMIPDIYYFPAGKTLLLGYLFLLLAPTIVIVPNAAYHSMASELDQGTFDVLSISPLSSLQVVSGKLAVAMVQSLLYFSALAPCIALTYLLRGVPIVTIAISLGWVGLMSLACASAGLLLASINRVGWYSTINSILLILLTLGMTIFLFSSLTTWISYGTIVEPQAAALMLVPMLVIASYCWLLILAAAAAIGMAGENYSTTIRWWVLAQSTLIVGTIILTWLLRTDVLDPANLFMEQELIVMLIFLAMHWGVVGTFLVGESGITSPRAQRSLPDTLLTRIFCTWMNPGSGPGYIFAISSFAGIVAMVSVSWMSRNLASAAFSKVLFVGLMLVGHLTFFLGTTRLIVMWIPQGVRTRMIISGFVMVILLIGSCFATLMISLVLNGMREPTLEWYSVLNVFWTYSEIDKIPAGSLEFLAILAALVFALNLVSLTRDVTLIRIATPERVRSERRQSGAHGGEGCEAEKGKIEEWNGLESE